MIKHFQPDTYLQVGRAEEMYAATYRCMTCQGTWSGHVDHNPAFPGEYPATFRFCPCCGIPLKGELARHSDRREELRCEAGWKGHYWAEAQKVTYVIQRRHEWMDLPGTWETDDRYYPRGTRQEILGSWRHRLRDGSWLGEEVRLVARTPSGEKVIFGPVFLAPDTHIGGSTLREETPSKIAHP